MYAASDHGGGEVMRAGDHIGHNVGIRRIGHTGLQDANHGSGAVADAAQADCFANHVGILFEDGRPEAIGENDNARSVGPIVLGADEAAENGMEAHHVEVGSAHHATLNFARLAEPDHGEADDREIAELLDGVDAGFNVLDFWNGEGGVFVAQARRALADVNEAVFVTIHERFEEHSAHEGEDCGVGADAERQRQDDNAREAFGAHQGMECNSQIPKKRHPSSPCDSRFG